MSSQYRRSDKINRSFKDKIILSPKFKHGNNTNSSLNTNSATNLVSAHSLMEFEFVDEEEDDVKISKNSGQLFDKTSIKKSPIKTRCFKSVHRRNLNTKEYKKCTRIVNNSNSNGNNNSDSNSNSNGTRKNCDTSVSPFSGRSIFQSKKKNTMTIKKKGKAKVNCLFEEEIVDGFAIFTFLSYHDLEKTVKEQEEGDIKDNDIEENNISKTNSTAGQRSLFAKTKPSRDVKSVNKVPSKSVPGTCSGNNHLQNDHITSTDDINLTNSRNRKIINNRERCMVNQKAISSKKTVNHHFNSNKSISRAATKRGGTKVAISSTSRTACINSTSTISKSSLKKSRKRLFKSSTVADRSSKEYIENVKQKEKYNHDDEKKEKIVTKTRRSTDQSHNSKSKSLKNLQSPKKSNSLVPLSNLKSPKSDNQSSNESSSSISKLNKSTASGSLSTSGLQSNLSNRLNRTNSHSRVSPSGDKASSPNQTLKESAKNVKTEYRSKSNSISSKRRSSFDKSTFDSCKSPNSLNAVSSPRNKLSTSVSSSTFSLTNSCDSNSTLENNLFECCDKEVSLEESNTNGSRSSFVKKSSLSSLPSSITNSKRRESTEDCPSHISSSKKLNSKSDCKDSETIEADDNNCCLANNNKTEETADQSDSQLLNQTSNQLDTKLPNSNHNDSSGVDQNSLSNEDKCRPNLASIKKSSDDENNRLTKTSPLPNSDSNCLKDLQTPKCEVNCVNKSLLTSNDNLTESKANLNGNQPFVSSFASNNLNQSLNKLLPLSNQSSNPSISDSLTSLSQLSQSIGEPLESRNCSSSGSVNTFLNNNTSNNNNSSNNNNKSRSFGSGSGPTSSSFTLNKSLNSITSTTFKSSKSHSWIGSSNPFLTASGSHLTSPNLTSRVAPLSSSSSVQHHPLSMFAHPIPAPSVSLSSVGGPVAPTVASSPFIGDSLFIPPSNQDLLRRELDTRFMASLDRSINIPPPPYMRTELHQPSHIHSNPTPFSLQASLSSSLVPGSSTHLYDKFSKLDSAFYGRNALGLPGFPSLSSILPSIGNHSTAAVVGSTPSVSVEGLSTPFGPPGHLSSFQAKKSGRWCAMHVRIAWEIYHNQQKSPTNSKNSSNHSTNGSKSLALNKVGHHSSDILEPLNNIFSLSPRPQDISSFSSSLLNTSQATSRASLDTPSLTSHPNPSFPSMGVPPFIRPGFSDYHNLASLGPLALAHPTTPGPASNGSSSSIFPASSSRDLPSSGSRLNDIWLRNNASSRSNPSLFSNFNSSATLNSSGWGGLKSESDKRHHDEREKRKPLEEARKYDSKANLEQHVRKERKLDVKDESNLSLKYTSTLSESNSLLKNGDTNGTDSSRKVDWDKSYKRELSRSPINHSSSKLFKTDHSAFNNSKSNDVQVKEERKEHSLSDRSLKLSANDNDVIAKNKSCLALSLSSSTLSSAAPITPSTSSLTAMNLNMTNSIDRNRLINFFGPTIPPQLGSLGTPGSTDPFTKYWTSFFPSRSHPVDPFKSLHDFPTRSEIFERDQLLQRYNILNSSGGGAPLIEKLAKDVPFHTYLEKDHQQRDKDVHHPHSNSLDKHKLSSLKAADSSALASSYGLSGHNPPMPRSHPNLFPPTPYFNSLHSLSSSVANNLQNKSQSLASSSLSSSASSVSSSSSSHSSSKSSPSPSQSLNKPVTISSNGITVSAPPPPPPPALVNNTASTPIENKLSVNNIIETSSTEAVSLKESKGSTDKENTLHSELPKPASYATNSVNESEQEFKSS